MGLLHTLYLINLYLSSFCRRSFSANSGILKNQYHIFTPIQEHLCVDLQLMKEKFPNFSASQTPTFLTSLLRLSPASASWKVRAYPTST
jgi:hypothetical protein